MFSSYHWTIPIKHDAVNVNKADWLIPVYCRETICVQFSDCFTNFMDTWLKHLNFTIFITKKYLHWCLLLQSLYYPRHLSTGCRINWNNKWESIYASKVSDFSVIRTRMSQLQVTKSFAHENHFYRWHSVKYSLIMKTDSSAVIYENYITHKEYLCTRLSNSCFEQFKEGNNRNAFQVINFALYKSFWLDDKIAHIITKNCYKREMGSLLAFVGILSCYH